MRENVEKIRINRNIFIKRKKKKKIKLKVTFTRRMQFQRNDSTIHSISTSAILKNSLLFLASRENHWLIFLKTKGNLHSSGLSNTRQILR